MPYVAIAPSAAALAARVHRLAALLLCGFMLAACGGAEDPGDAGSVREAAQRRTTPPPPTPVGGTFLRPAGAAPLLGMNIGAKNYDDPAYQQALARLDVAILAFHPGWRGDTDGKIIQQAVVALKKLNPALKVGQYTMLNESADDPAKTANDDVIVKLNDTDWWLRNADDDKVQWTPLYTAYDINITDWTEPDANGERFPQWLARRNHARYFDPIPELDVWYFDGVMKYSRIGQADWRLGNENVSSQLPDVAAAYRRGHLANWTAAASLAPTRLLIGNTDNDLSYPEYRGALPAAFLESLMGKSWSIEQRGWTTMMQRYFSVAANLRAPALVGFNVFGALNDYRFFRYAFMSCRLGNGHFSYTDSAVGYSSVPWFDEYEVAFGAAKDAPSLQPWSNGVYRRRFEKAMVLVNPNDDARTVSIAPGWRRLLASQDAQVNNGAAVKTLTIPAKDGLVLVPQ
jgi:hypothetical protein